MTMDDLDAEISYLMEQLEGEPGDLHEIFFRPRLTRIGDPIKGAQPVVGNQKRPVAQFLDVHRSAPQLLAHKPSLGKNFLA